jgi:hypothetical protein
VTPADLQLLRMMCIFLLAGAGAMFALAPFLMYDEYTGAVNMEDHPHAGVKVAVLGVLLALPCLYVEFYL